MMQLQDFRALSHVPFFADVPFGQVSGLAEAFEIEEVTTGHRFFNEGDDDECLFLVLQGEVEACTQASGRRRVMSTYNMGDFFGVMSLVDAAPRWSTCTATVPTRVARLDRSAYRALAGGSPDLALAFQRCFGKTLSAEFRALRKAATERGRRARSALTAVPKRAEHDVDCDVAVLGAGPLGMMYAQWILQLRPGTRVTMLERREVPGYKVGESTLSTTVRAFLSMGFTMPQMRRLFGNKAGIRFWWTGPDSTGPEQHTDVLDLEETFQIERRVFEMALQRLTRERGVDLRLGVHVDVDDSNFEGEVKTLACNGPDGEYQLRTHIVCDATGPASVLPRHLEVYRKQPKVHDTFQTNCYFAYFRQKKHCEVPRWQEPATRHLMFPEGWMWFITVHSWETADDKTAMAFVNDIMDHTSDTDEELPSRQDFAKKHGIEFDLVTSIGMTVRDDMDTAKNLPIQERFQHYADRYPGIRFILDHYELIEKPYKEKRRPYAAYIGLAHDSTQIAGDGWCAIGDSALFSNPLFSHGINYGSGTAYMAAVDTAKAVEAKNFGRSAFANYEQYGADIYPVLLHQTDFLYRSWAHPDSFESTLMSVFYAGALDVVARHEYSESDPYVFDLLNPEWLKHLDEARAILKRFDAETGDPKAMAAELRALVAPYHAAWRARAKEINIDLSGVFSNFDGTNPERLASRDKPRALFKAYKCPTCTLWQDDTLMKCPNCGTDNPFPFVAPMTDQKKKHEPVEVRVVAPMPASTALSGVAAARAIRRTFHPLLVAAVIEETPSAKSFVFEVPQGEENDYAYDSGQFLTLAVPVGHEVLKRCYSLASAPSADKQLKITVKRVEGGRVSNWLCDNVKAGDTLQVLQPEGRFKYTEADGDVFLFAAGSGITPIFSIAKEVLATSTKRVRLVYVNRSRAETIFAAEIHALRTTYGKRFKVTYRIGSDEGRIDTRDVQTYCDQRTKGQFFTCGPWGFMDTVEEALLDMGVDPDLVHVERFASPTVSKPSIVVPILEGTPTREITLDIFGTKHKVPCKPGQSLTAAAFEFGVDAPSSCEEGYCGTCVARLIKGQVVLGVDDALSKGQKKRGFILACQAFPKGEDVEVVFES